MSTSEVMCPALKTGTESVFTQYFDLLFLLTFPDGVLTKNHVRGSPIVLVEPRQLRHHHGSQKTHLGSLVAHTFLSVANNNLICDETSFRFLNIPSPSYIVSQLYGAQR
jgi:hypothetical protein